MLVGCEQHSHGWRQRGLPEQSQRPRDGDGPPEPGEDEHVRVFRKHVRDRDAGGRGDVCDGGNGDGRECWTGGDAVAQRPQASPADVFLQHAPEPGPQHVLFVFMSSAGFVLGQARYLRLRAQGGVERRESSA